MNGKPKTKLCWNCEGSTAYEAEHCPYCGVSLTPLSIGDSAGNKNLFAPPYRMGSSSAEQSIPSSPFAAEEAAESESVEQIPSQSEASELIKMDDLKSYLTPLILLLAGSMMFLFGLALILFADNDSYLVLRWDASLWYVYLALSVPMLFFGWRTLNQLPEDKG